MRGGTGRIDIKWKTTTSMKNNILYGIIWLAYAVAGMHSTARAESAVALESLLNEMIDRDAVARWPEPAFTCKQASSYDRRSKTPADPAGWFANNDWSQFIRSEEHQGRREWVMMDADGPGCVVRFWTGGKPAVGTVRFYLDNAAEPCIAAQLQDLLSGRAFVQRPLAIENPKQAGNLYLPIPYAKHCTITYDEKDPKDPAAPPQQRWYNIEYRTYAAGTKVKSFSMDDLKSVDVFVTLKILSGRRPRMVRRRSTLDTTLAPGQAASAALPAGPAAVYNMELHLDNPDAQSLRSLVLRATFDGEETIWCPVGDFFGSGVGLNELESWNRTVTKDGTLRCRWTMPFKTSATFTLLNLGKAPVPVTLNTAQSPWTWDDRSMHFHANWRQQNPLSTRPMSDWNYITTTGKGVYVGDTLCVFNPVSDWWGEGDEKIWVDGETFPSHFGTGSEDHYGYAWGDAHLFQGPFANQVRCDGPGNLGHTVVTRTRSLDAIPFTKSLQFDMEVWHWKECQVGYAATTYWYALPGATSNRGPQSDEAARAIPETPGVVKLKDAIECEKMPIVAQTPGLAIETQTGGLTAGGWSGGAQLFVRGRKPGDFVELKVTTNQSAPSKLTLYATKSWDYGVLRFSVNGKAVEKDFDAYNATAVTSGPIELGAHEPKDGQFILRVEVVGSNLASKGTKSYFGLDAVTVMTP
ncbi:MAG TPA: glycoside hydrolase family 172 protein [Planctomycetota bacterium]|nr:glycoside hydrolase family 172 protein [Planctomycetota bacterium]